MFERRRHICWLAALLVACVFALPSSVAARNGGASVDDPGLKPPKKAKLTSAGKVIPPRGAPKPVVRAIDAANRISDKPYRWGGGHRNFEEDSGYDCSGTMSYVLHEANPKLLVSPITADVFMNWGEPGRGRWITTYGSGGHSFMIIAGIRFDTGYHGGNGPRWSKKRRPSGGFVKRHPPGL